MASEERKASNFKDKAVGTVKEKVGQATNNEEMELKGKSQRLKGEAGEKIENAKEGVAGAVNDAVDKLENKDR